MKCIKKKLKNGLRIISVPMKENPTVTVFVLSETGSEYERKEKNGISHFLEHMCFKGTLKRPNASIISKELDALGAQYNAFTSKVYTGYYVKTNPQHLDTALDVVSDIYMNSIFSEKEIEKEKGVIIEEINMYSDLPQRIVSTEFENLLYGDQPAGWKISGTKDTVSNITRADLIDYRNKHYTANSTIVVVAGRFKEGEISKKISKYFKKIGCWKKQQKTRTIEKQNSPQVSLYYKETDQTHIVLGFRTFDVKDKRNIPMRLLSGVLSGGMSSRLFQKMREDMGICYYVHAENDTYLDYGNFSVSAGIDSSRIFEGVKAILGECYKLREELVSEEELKKVKCFLTGNLVLGLESSDSIASFFGGQEVMGEKIKSKEEIIKEIESVKAQDIKDLAIDIFSKNTLNLSVVGKFKDKEAFLKVLNS